MSGVACLLRSKHNRFRMPSVLLLLCSLTSPVAGQQVMELHSGLTLTWGVHGDVVNFAVQREDSSLRMDCARMVGIDKDDRCERGRRRCGGVKTFGTSRPPLGQWMEGRTVRQLTSVIAYCLPAQRLADVRVSTVGSTGRHEHRLGCGQHSDPRVSWERARVRNFAFGR